MKSTPDPKQEELALSSVRAHALFPGRTTLYVHEVVRALSLSENQVIDLIESGDLAAVNIASGLQSAGNPNGSKTPRKYWRIPVSAFDAFVAQRKNL